jgi:hypothetical protein
MFIRIPASLSGDRFRLKSVAGPANCGAAKARISKAHAAAMLGRLEDGEGADHGRGVRPAATYRRGCPPMWPSI